MTTKKFNVVKKKKKRERKYKGAEHIHPSLNNFYIYSIVQ